MSLERRRASDGSARFVVRWRQGGKNKAKSFRNRQDARRWDAEVQRRGALGELGMIDAARRRVTELHEAWWSSAEANLSPKTREMYQGAWRTHLEKRIGSHRLSEVTPQAVEDLVGAMRRAGVGDGAITKALVVLSNMFSRAVVWGWVARNPVDAVKRPSQRKGSRVVRPIPPSKIEEIRSALGVRDATLVSVLGYAGLRPGEALALKWRDVSASTIVVEKSASMGEERSTKTRRNRTVRLLAPLAADLAEWRLASGRPGDDELVFPGHDGALWGADDWKNWRRRIFAPAARAIGLPCDTRPYDLRHSFVSLLLAERRSPLDVARQAGHSPTMTLDTYGHVIEELDSTERVPAEEAVRRARERARGNPATPVQPAMDPIGSATRGRP